MCILCNFIDFFDGKLGVDVVHCQEFNINIACSYYGFGVEHVLQQDWH
jgi:hypothetical protein